MNKSYSIYIWLIDLIRHSRGITLQQINEHWVKSPSSNGIPLHRNSFRRHCKSIERNFGIRIAYNASTFEYSIPSQRDFSTDTLKGFLLSTMTVANILDESRSLQNRILLENVPSGQYFLAPITRAMEEGFSLNMTYQKFSDAEPYTARVDPYALKLFRQRWYLLGLRYPERKLKTYALDRMHNIQIDSSHPFVMPSDFDANAYFQYSFGIYHFEDAPQQIRIRTYNGLGNFYRTLPLHSSQVEVESTPQHIDFQLTLVPSFDFIQELLSQGSNLEVLTPQSLREQLSNTLSEAQARYQKG